MKFNVNIGTFNVRSICSEIRKEQLITDVKNYRLDVLCVQETKIKDGVDLNINGCRLICFPSDSEYYGNGFIISERCKQLISSTWKVSDRICVLQLTSESPYSRDNEDRSGKSKSLTVTIINVYAPTSERVRKYPEEIDKFYDDLDHTITKLGTKTILILAGDFNAKVGKRLDGDRCLGSYSKGTRNSNGEKLVEFCEKHNLFVTNSAYNHPSRHQTTWMGRIKDAKSGKFVNIYNQIDFVICRHRHKQYTSNARSYGGTTLTTDHKLVKTNFTIELYKQRKCSNVTQTNKINKAKIVHNRECRIHYQHELNKQLWEIEKQNNSPNTKWKQTQEAIKHAATESAGTVTKTKTNTTPDTVIAELSKQQKDIRIQIQNCNDEDEVSRLKTQRNRVLHDIRKRSLKLRNEELDHKVEEIERARDNQSMYKAVRALNQKPFQNPKIEDKNGKQAVNPNEILEIVSSHFKEKFHDDSTNKIEPFKGVPKPLTQPISPNEIRNSIERLNNNKSPGDDEITSELLKHGTLFLDATIAGILNEAFSKHQDLDINSGILITLPKPGKPKGPPQNLRPITLLNTVRKILSTLTLNRIRPKIESYLSLSQSGFRTDRSTSDVVWTHKWMAAKANVENVQIKITGIDMTAAFDTIDRQILLDILETIVDEDELRIIRFLLSNTTLSARINGATIHQPFDSNVGTPQGDSLSPVLFTVYLEHALKEVRTIFNEPQSTLEEHLPREVSYADDVDFIGCEYLNINHLQEILAAYGLQVNANKTEYTTLSRESSEWKGCKKVGSLIGDEEDIARRKQLAAAALHKLMNIWLRNKKTKLATKMKLYKTLVKPILMYNCGTWGMKKSDAEKIDTFHRKQLRTVLNIRYPKKISNKSLYKKCNESPLSLQILEHRWRLFGHILRRDKNIPANKAMSLYFIKCAGRFKGRPITTLPITLNNDLSQTSLSLKSTEDLEELRIMAEDRQKWKELTQKLLEAAEASQSMDSDAKGN